MQADRQEFPWFEVILAAAGGLVVGGGIGWALGRSGAQTPASGLSAGGVAAAGALPQKTISAVTTTLHGRVPEQGISAGPGWHGALNKNVMTGKGSKPDQPFDYGLGIPVEVPSRAGSDVDRLLEGVELFCATTCANMIHGSRS